MPAGADTPTARALAVLDTSARGIEAHSVRVAPTAVKSRSGDGSSANPCPRPHRRLPLLIPMASATVSIKSFFAANIAFAIFAPPRS
jgi:hypothetical protein